MPRKRRASSPEAFSHDQAVKKLVKTYPSDALEFLAPDITTAKGLPTSITFLDPAVSKDITSEPGTGMAMDLAIRYQFASGPAVVIVLIEHWSSASRLDLLRTARYYLDLCRRFPHDDIIPIALVDDSREYDLPDRIERGGCGNVHLMFHTRIIQIPSLELERYRGTANRVALSFSPNMKGDFDRQDQVFQVTLTFSSWGDMEGVHALFPFWVVEGKLTTEQQHELIRRLKEQDMPEIMDWLRQEGIEIGIERGIERGVRSKALDAAHKMREHGITWDIVTDVTGIRAEDLKAD